MTVSCPGISGFPIRIDTLAIQRSNDYDLTERTWYLDHFYSPLNDSIPLLFKYGLVKASLKFDKDWGIFASDSNCGFRGAYRISKDKRILIKNAGSKAKLCTKDTLNDPYQHFLRSFSFLIHESRYSVSNDSLFITHQTRYMLFIDSVKANTEYFKKKKISENDKKILRNL